VTISPSDFHDTHFAKNDDILRLSLPLNEALNNALVHGNLEMSSDMVHDEEWDLEKMKRLKNPLYGSRNVFLTVTFDSDSLTFTVRDEGRGFNYRDVMASLNYKNIDKFSGRGLFIIINFTDEVAFNDIGNEITMSISKDTLLR